MITAEEMFNYLSSLNENSIIFTNHFLENYKKRGNDLPIKEEIIKIILSQCPEYIVYQDDNKFKVFYILTEKYDLVIVMVVRVINPNTIRLITVYKQKAHRRFRT